MKLRNKRNNRVVAYSTQLAPLNHMEVVEDEVVEAPPPPVKKKSRKKAAEEVPPAVEVAEPKRF